MKIFYLIDSLNVGGSETQAVETAIRMKERGHHLVFGVLRLQGPLLERLESYDIETIEFSPGSSLMSLPALRQTWRLARYLRRERFDVVHTHDLYANLLGVPAARLAKTPTIIAAQRDLSEFPWYTPRRKCILRRIQRLAHFVVANSSVIRDGLIADGIAPERIHVMYNGIDPSRFSSDRDLRSSLMPNWGPEHFVAIMVANMHIALKGHAVLIDAVSKLYRDFPQLRVALVGDGDLRPELEAKAKRLGVRDRFLFLGRRGDVPDLLACSDLGLLPSLSEGFPNSVLEYMAAGLPVVATSVGGIPELVQQNVTGLIVPPDEPSALADAIASMLHNISRAKAQGIKARDQVESHFGFESLLDRLERLYITAPSVRQFNSPNHSVCDCEFQS